MTEYEKGYIDGVNALLKKIQDYYNTLGGKTVGVLVSYTAETHAKTLTESILGGEGYILPSKERKSEFALRDWINIDSLSEI